MGDVVALRARAAGGLLGLDRLSLSFPLRALDFSAFDRVALERDDLGELDAGSMVATVRGHPGGPVDGASVTLGARRVAGAWWGKVEANPSRLVDPAGCSLMPLAGWLPTLGAFSDVVWSYGMVPATDPEDWRVKRVDVARDFRGVVAPEFYVRGLAHLKRSHAKRSGLWSDADCGAAQTLHVGSGAGMVRLYDQHAAYASRGAPQGSLRWEVEARRGWLDRHGVRCAGDVSMARLEDIALERWEWSRMGETVTGTANVVDAVSRIVGAGGFFDDAGLWRPVSRMKADRALGMLVRECLGTDWGASNDSHADYERLKRHLGVTPSAELFDCADVSVRGRLDFDQGVEVAA